MAPVMIIPLGRELPHASSDLPGSLGRATLKRSPIWSCSGWGLPSRPGCPDRWWSLTPPFHPCLCRDTPGSRVRAWGMQAIGGLLSVALSVGSPRLGVTQQPALWSSDFPQTRTAGACDHLTSSDAPGSEGVCIVSPLQNKMRWQWEHVRMRSWRRTSWTSCGGKLRKHP
jgi:hypothetical protein